MDNALLPQGVGGPGNTPAVVAVGGGDEGNVSKDFSGFGRGQHIVAGFGQGFSQPPGQIIADGVAAAKNLEGVESEPVGFVLHIDGTDAQHFSSLRQLRQGRGGVHGKTFVKFPDFFRLLQTVCFRIAGWFSGMLPGYQMKRIHVHRKTSKTRF